MADSRNDLTEKQKQRKRKVVVADILAAKVAPKITNTVSTSSVSTTSSQAKVTSEEENKLNSIDVEGKNCSVSSSSTSSTSESSSNSLSQQDEHNSISKKPAQKVKPAPTPELSFDEKKKKIECLLKNNSALFKELQNDSICKKFLGSFFVSIQKVIDNARTAVTQFNSASTHVAEKECQRHLNNLEDIDIVFQVILKISAAQESIQEITCLSSDLQKLETVLTNTVKHELPVDKEMVKKIKMAKQCVVALNDVLKFYTQISSHKTHFPNFSSKEPSIKQLCKAVDRNLNTIFRILKCGITKIDVQSFIQQQVELLKIIYSPQILSKDYDEVKTQCIAFFLSPDFIDKDSEDKKWQEQCMASLADLQIQLFNNRDQSMSSLDELLNDSNPLRSIKREIFRIQSRENVKQEFEKLLRQEFENLLSELILEKKELIKFFGELPQDFYSTDAKEINVEKFDDAKFSTVFERGASFYSLYTELFTDEDQNSTSKLKSLIADLDQCQDTGNIHAQIANLRKNLSSIKEDKISIEKQLIIYRKVNELRLQVIGFEQEVEQFYTTLKQSYSAAELSTVKKSPDHQIFLSTDGTFVLKETCKNIKEKLLITNSKDVQNIEEKIKALRDEIQGAIDFFNKHKPKINECAGKSKIERQEKVKKIKEKRTLNKKKSEEKIIDQNLEKQKEDLEKQKADAERKRLLELQALLSVKKTACAPSVMQLEKKLGDLIGHLETLLNKNKAEFKSIQKYIENIKNILPKTTAIGNDIFTSLPVLQEDSYYDTLVNSAKTLVSCEHLKEKAKIPVNITVIEATVKELDHLSTDFDTVLESKVKEDGKSIIEQIELIKTKKDEQRKIMKNVRDVMCEQKLSLEIQNAPLIKNKERELTGTVDVLRKKSDALKQELVKLEEDINKRVRPSYQQGVDIVRSIFQSKVDVQEQLYKNSLSTKDRIQGWATHQKGLDKVITPSRKKIDCSAKRNNFKYLENDCIDIFSRFKEILNHDNLFFTRVQLEKKLGKLKQMVEDVKKQINSSKLNTLMQMVKDVKQINSPNFIIDNKQLQDFEVLEGEKLDIQLLTKLNEVISDISALSQYGQARDAHIKLQKEIENHRNGTKSLSTDHDVTSKYDPDIIANQKQIDALSRSIDAINDCFPRLPSFMSSSESSISTVDTGSNNTSPNSSNTTSPSSSKNSSPADSRNNLPCTTAESCDSENNVGSSTSSTSTTASSASVIPNSMFAQSTTPSSITPPNAQDNSPSCS